MPSKQKQHYCAAISSDSSIHAKLEAFHSKLERSIESVTQPLAINESPLAERRQFFRLENTFRLDKPAKCACFEGIIIEFTLFTEKPREDSHESGPSLAVSIA